MTTTRPATLDVAVLVAGAEHDDPRPAMTMPLAPAMTSREALREGIRRAIELGVLPPGVRLRRGNDIARAVGLSRSTVSAAVFDLVHEGLIDRCVGGGAVVRTRNDRPAITVVPMDDELRGPLVEEVGVLAVADVDQSVRRYTQHLWGRKVAEVRIECDPRWWSPAPRLRWADPLAPAAGVTEVDLRMTEHVDTAGERWLRVRAIHRGLRGQCVVDLGLAKGLYAVQAR
ncbi:GntR family transcriptional regulator [Curtobacterium flaccumfaciens]|nr:GntR family transcriptional regulator [Curtobacterium flaccumfaciens]